VPYTVQGCRTRDGEAAAWTVQTRREADFRARLLAQAGYANIQVEETDDAPDSLDEYDGRE
jgi:hypothetical protein